ncbi:hypothetical protein J8F10_03405 [Gemmata sp. G18]|uniref:Zinc ribbon domain-containing protein n=1 Tax=Gemmata palustris TaxID=2822762 RepID=A0ABS5BN95_9BACT|nr:hypothetical protein [Gemmata palustris]MBP3954343.1 hypothetical protein [Gemmata palustris]
MPQCPRCEALMDAVELICPQCGHRLKEEIVYRAGYEPQELLDLGLSPRFVTFIFLESKPKPFDYWCDSPHAGWACAIPREVSGVYPLWCCGSDPTVLWMRRGRIEFVQLYHDDPTVRFLARTEQGLLAHLFIRLLESADWHHPESVSRLRPMAELTGFHHFDQLCAWYQHLDERDNYSEQFDLLMLFMDGRTN